MSPLQPSISREQYGSLESYIECVEVYVLRRRGSIGEGQSEWIETFACIPPAEFDIDRNVKAALAELAA